MVMPSQLTVGYSKLILTKSDIAGINECSSGIMTWKWRKVVLFTNPDSWGLVLLTTDFLTYNLKKSVYNCWNFFQLRS